MSSVKDESGAPVGIIVALASKEAIEEPLREEKRALDLNPFRP